MTKRAIFRAVPALLMAASITSTTPASPGAEDGGNIPSPPDLGTAAWTGKIDPFSSPPKRIVIEGVKTVDGFEPHRATVPAPVSADAEEPVRLIALGRNSLTDTSLRTFGATDRVTAIRDGDSVRIECQPGHAPAGAIIDLKKRYFPRAVDASLAIRGETDAGFRVDLVTKDDDGTPVAGTELEDGWNRLNLPRAGYSRTPRLIDIAITCPASAGSLTLTALQIDIRGSGRPFDPPATWIWSVAPLLDDPAGTISRLVEKRIGRVYLQLAIRDGQIERADELRDLLAALGARGISVVAVEGDARMVRPAGLANALDRLDVIRAFNATLPERTRLDGIQYDIEPYTLAEYTSDPAAIWNAWGEAISALSDRWGGTISVVVPFWMLGNAAAHDRLAEVSPAISDVVVMAYRTELGTVVSISEPWLAWGALNDMPVIIALENGPLPVEVHRTYRRAETGSLAVLSKDGEHQVALWSSALIKSSQFPLYDLSHEVVVAPGRISFLDDERKLADVAGRVGNLLANWPSFRGLAIHEYIAWR